jgi:hypothetical protein
MRTTDSSTHLQSRKTLLSTALLLGACCASNPPKQDHAAAIAAAPAPAPARATAALSAPITFQGGFQADCEPPFAHPGNTSDFDQECGNEGTPEEGDKEARTAEYEVKNNLCADASSPVKLSFADFKKLQGDLSAVSVTIGDQNVSVPDRSVLRDLPLSRGRTIGEGKVVRLVGLATVKTSQSNEGVNCHKTTEAMTDIHINVSPDGEECDGVVVEIIPHRRPLNWTHGDATNRLDQSIVRVTGQLFLDSRHSVNRTSPSSCPTPKRMSLWEVHPVYAMEICKRGTLTECKADDDSVWKAF